MQQQKMLALALVALCALATLTYTAVQELAWIRASSTEASVTAVDCLTWNERPYFTVFDESDYFRCTTTVRFDDAGGTHSVAIEHMPRRKPERGQSLEVHYMVGDPSVARIPDESKLLFHLLCFGLLAGTILVSRQS